MGNTTLADLIEDYEKNINVLKRQLEQVNAEIPRSYGDKKQQLVQKKCSLEDMLSEAHQMAHELKKYCKG